MERDAGHDRVRLEEQRALDEQRVLVVEEVLQEEDFRPLALWIDSQPAWSDFPIVVLSQRGGGLHHLEGSFTFLLPAGLRPVKNVLFALPLLAELYREEPGLRFLLAGPIIDAEYGARVLAQLEAYPFARYLGAVGHDAMACLYQQADVVLNTSLFEGGMATSILEALAMVWKLKLSV